MEIQNCPNCNAQIKYGLISDNLLFQSDGVKIINEYAEKKATAYCNKCGDQLFEQCKQKIVIEKNRLLKTIEPLMDMIPVISSQSPYKWEYEVLGMVTGQSTTGTGIFSEFKSSFTDFFGAQSGSYNKKLKQGEDLCFNQLREKALNMGGNAVIATDIDYSEIGGEKGMLMVCMAGTAIKLLNPDIIGNEKSKKIKELAELCLRLLYLNNLYSPYVVVS